MKNKKGKPQKNSRNYLNDFLNALNTVVAFFLIIIVALYFLTDYAMTAVNPQYIEYFNLTKETAAYMHHQLTLPFCVLMLIFILPSLNKK